MEPRQLLYNLETPLKFSKKGDYEDCYQLDIDPPCFVNYKQSSRLAQYFTRTLFSSRKLLMELQDTPEEPKETEEGNLDASMVATLLLASDMDIVKSIDCFRELLLSSCYLDRESNTKIKQKHFSEISHDDMMAVMCEYFSTFIVPSVMSRLPSEGDSKKGESQKKEISGKESSPSGKG